MVLAKSLGRLNSTRNFFSPFPMDWRPKVTTIKEANDLTTMSMEEFVGCLVTHEHTLQMDNGKMENKKKKKKNLALKTLMQEDELDEEMTLITRNFKRSLRRKVGAPTPRRQEDEDRAKEGKKSPKIKEEDLKDKIRCYKCKCYRHMMHECPSKDKDLDPKRKKVLQATLELDEFCFMAIEVEREKDFERAFEELYVETICMAKKNKKIKEQLEAITKEDDVLKEELRSKDKELIQS